MIKMEGADTLDFCGFPYDISTPLGLPPGWSWISYLPRDTMSVDDALGSLEATGEYIKDQISFSEYVPAWNGWFGTLVEMCPGEGYKIRMAEADTLTYPDSVEVTGPALASGRAAGCLGSERNRCNVCNIGLCPKGITSQNPKLYRRLDPDKVAERVVETFMAIQTEMKKVMAPLGRSQSLPIGMSDAIGINDKDAADRLNIRYVC